MKVTKSQIPEIADFLVKFWEMIKNYYIPEENQSYWDNVIAEGDRIAKGDLQVKVVNAFLHYLEDKYKNGQGITEEGPER
jgi:hypothetical protein